MVLSKKVLHDSRASWRSKSHLTSYEEILPESRLQKRFSVEIKDKETENNVTRKQIVKLSRRLMKRKRYDAMGTSKAENQGIKMQKLLKVANEVNAQEKETS